MNNEQNPQEAATQPQNTTQPLQPQAAEPVQPPAPQASPAQAQPQSPTQAQPPAQPQPQPLQPSQPQQPTANPNPQQTASPVNGAPVAAGPALSNSPNTQQEKKRKFPKWAIITLSVLLFIAAAIAIIALVFPGRFSTYTYEDSKGTQYSLKYYKESTTQSVSGLPGSSAITSAPLKFLTAPSGKYPLAISITKTSEYSRSLYSGEDNPLCEDPAFKLDNPADGQSDIVCHVTVDDKELMYFYEISDGDDKHLVIITQDFDTTVPESSRKAYMKKLLDDPDFNLRDFNDDLQVILPSIKVVD
ncbi:hypothetical protein CSA80_03275 [Candidatus Saccharibacteria bacterium]|nr:MAG: hypothetical protein CSA80_03275 [Candidatus Saccharibacteria bacterium]